MQMKKFIGKPYAGKPHVRFDEGAGKVLLSFPLYSTVICGICLYFIILSKLISCRNFNVKKQIYQ
jgi:hypothetical protein